MSENKTSPYGDDTAAVLSAREYAALKGLPDPYRAYYHHRNGAKVRGIGWEFTFAQWWEMWRPYFHLRGRGKNNLCMAREGDVGPYSPDNVYLTTFLGNIRDYYNSPQAIEIRKAKKEAGEMRYARAGTDSKFKNTDKLSHITFKAFNTSKSTCNYKEDELELGVGPVAP